MDNDRPTLQNVLFSRQRARDLRALGQHELIEPSDREKGSDRRLRIGAQPDNARTLHDAIFKMMESGAKLGFDDRMVADAGDEFVPLASADSPRDRDTPARLVFCVLHILKLALQDGEPIERAIDAIEITESG